MTTENEIVQEPVSEAPVDTGTVQEVQMRQVPLEALEAERHKRQEAEAAARLYQDYALKYKEAADAASRKPVNNEDDSDLVNVGHLKQFHEKLTREELFQMKREISEETYKEVNPDAIKTINSNLKEILEKRPWLADSIQSAPNRYSRAYEICKDFAQPVQQKKVASEDARKLVENSMKPGNPVTLAKSAQGSQADFMKSMQGKKEFNDYRKQLLQGK